MKGIIFLGAMLLMASCTSEKHNVLTEAEKAEGWQLLFDDGVTTLTDVNNKTINERRAYLLGRHSYRS